MGQHYKFYFAFENSLCIDYVTEKFFLAFKYNMVPVTFGWVDYSLYGPPGSYINALDFDSVEDLANYLLYLDKNDVEYLKYFEWKGQYKIQFLHIEDQLCLICKAVSNYQKRGMKNFSDDDYQVHERQTEYKGVKKWHESLPYDETRTSFRIGKTIILNVTKSCVEPYKHDMFKKWIFGE